MIDIVKVKQEIKTGKLTVKVQNGKILLEDTKSGECVCIGEAQHG